MTDICLATSDSTIGVYLARSLRRRTLESTSLHWNSMSRLNRPDWLETKCMRGYLTELDRRESSEKCESDIGRAIFDVGSILSHNQ